MRTNLKNKQTVMNWLNNVSKNGKNMAFVSQVKINELHDLKTNELIYGHYVYIFGNSMKQENNALELLSKSGLIIYVKSNVHTEVERLIESTKIPYILISNLDLDDINNSSESLIMNWASKKSLENLALTFAHYCKKLFDNKNYLSEESLNYSLLESTNEKWRKLWYTSIPIRRRSRIYKCISKKNVYKRKA